MSSEKWVEARCSGVPGVVSYLFVCLFDCFFKMDLMFFIHVEMVYSERNSQMILEATSLPTVRVLPNSYCDHLLTEGAVFPSTTRA